MLAMVESSGLPLHNKQTSLRPSSTLHILSARNLSLMNTTNISEIAVWIDSVSAPQTVYEAYPLTALGERELTTSRLSSEVSEVESHQSGRLSPVKQLQLLEDFEEQPVVFCNFDDDEEGEEPEDVTVMRRATQQFADGIGILGYDDINAVVSALPLIDRMRFQYSWANDREQRCLLGSMPPIAQIRDVVETARKYDHGSGVSEDEWNSEVQHPLLKLARNTSKHRQTLDIHNVKTARIEPASLARSTLPGRVVDYVVALNPSSATKQAWRCLRLLPGISIKSWNHTTRARHNPIAINIETKGPMKSWTDGKPQIAIWTDAWLKRLALIRGNSSGQWPAVPLLIAQGHD
ncbi:MFS monocarboxylate transporter [Pyrenophora seminiperda CCB06]|uniref:MFS monocarboxylate transporter n=1 Tax=Pyrenophora seminiperda CCB06 TaxID=1302712 RepID=A0A3M7MBZ7_9PLEO|nr:MFS monocarboxylate transporter [Pyrenophora seminiperda CCB06]